MISLQAYINFEHVTPAGLSQRAPMFVCQEVPWSSEPSGPIPLA